MLEKMGAMRNAYGEALVELGASNSRIVVLGADTTDSMKSGMFGAKYPDRFFNLGIAEQNLIGVAAGLAFGGKVAYAGTYAIFVPGKCVDQIRNMLCYADLDVKVVCSHAGITVGPDGGSHEQVEDIALMRRMGFDHVRISVNPQPMFNSGHADQLPAEYLGYLDAAVKMIHDQGLAVILDVHPESLITSTALTVYYMPAAITPIQVIRVLNSARIRFMLVGAHGIGGWTGAPRATRATDPDPAQ